jgi:cytochrome c oxidase subunit 2
MKTSKRPLEAYFLFLVFILIVVLGSASFFKKWMPPLASNRISIDQMMTALFIVTGVFFVGVQGLTGYFIWKYSNQNVEKAAYVSGSHALEITWTLGTAVILAVFGVWSVRVWRKTVIQPPPSHALQVEVVAQQFSWNFLYPNQDGVFGKLNPQYISFLNPLGLDPKDPASRGDIWTKDNLYLPVGKPVVLKIRSLDVVHSFFVPDFRVKQDAVPGMAISTWFIPEKKGKYEIACSQFCGRGHYTMRGTCYVVSQKRFRKELKHLRKEDEGE